MGFDGYFDQAGLLTNILNGYDGGDSAQMTGLYRFGRWMKFRNDPAMLAREQAKLSSELDILTYTQGHDYIDLTGVKHDSISYPGIYVRHPMPCSPSWVGNPHTFSRDQQRSLVFAMGALKQKKSLWQIFCQHVKRLGWYQNDQDSYGNSLTPDFIAPNVLGEYVRAGFMAGSWFLSILWPLLLASDLFMFIGVLISLYQQRDPNEADDDNLILSLLQAKVSLPTPLSWLSRKIFKLFRPNGYDYGMKTKHRQETGSPPFYLELFKEILDREL